MPLELALVRWYEAVNLDDDSEEAELRMQKVIWETTGRGKDLCGDRYDRHPHHHAGCILTATLEAET